MSDQQNPQPVQFAPGMHVLPGLPMTYVAQGKQVQTPNGIERVVVLHVEHTTGSTVLVLPAEYAKGLAHAILREATGIEVASASPLLVPGA